MSNTPPGNRTYAFSLAFAAALGGFLFGYDFVIIAGAQLYLKEQFKLVEGVFWARDSFGFAISSAVWAALWFALAGGLDAGLAGTQKRP